MITVLKAKGQPAFEIKLADIKRHDKHSLNLRKKMEELTLSVKDKQHRKMSQNPEWKYKVRLKKKETHNHNLVYCYASFASKPNSSNLDQTAKLGNVDQT